MMSSLISYVSFFFMLFKFFSLSIVLEDDTRKIILPVYNDNKIFLMLILICGTSKHPSWEVLMTKTEPTDKWPGLQSDQCDTDCTSQSMLKDLEFSASVHIVECVIHSGCIHSWAPWSEKTSIESSSIVRHPLISGRWRWSMCIWPYSHTCLCLCRCLWVWPAVSEGAAVRETDWQKRSSGGVKKDQHRWSTGAAQGIRAPLPRRLPRSATYTCAASPANPGSSGRDWARSPSSLSWARRPSDACRYRLGGFITWRDSHPQMYRHPEEHEGEDVQTGEQR